MIKLFEDFNNSNELLSITKDVFQDLIDRSTGYYDRHKDIVNYISFGMNTELEYAW